MAQGSIGVRLIIGVAKAISQSNKDAQKSRVRAAREDQKRIQKEMNALEAQLKQVRKISAAQEKEQQRTFSAETKRIVKENERRLAAEEKEKQLNEKEKERAKIQNEKDAKRNAESRLKENIRRARAELDDELCQGESCRIERCNERRNLRQAYIRRLLK
ncbi:MAG: hypothetical protein ABL858_07375 [Candidatus Nitrotoga sp.]